MDLVAMLKTAVAAPVIGFLLMPATDSLPVKARNACAVAPALAAFGACALLLFPVMKGLTAVYRLDFLPGLDFILSADMLSVFAACVSSFAGVLVLVYSLDYTAHCENRTGYYAMATLFLGSMTGLFFSANLLWMYVFWETAAFAGWRLAVFFSPGGDSAGADRTLLITVSGGLCMLLGILMVYSGKGTLELRSLRGETIPMAAAVLMLAGIFAKSAVLPFSGWLTGSGGLVRHSAGDGGAASSAPALLYATLLIETGVYAYARIFGATFTAPPGFSGLALALAGLSALVSAGAALIETDIGKIIAYSAASQTGFIFLGLACGNKTGFAGGLLYLLTHAMAKCGLFLCAGIIERNIHTRDITRMGGLARTMPVTALSFALASLSVMGIPPFGGFFSKFLVFKGAVQNGSPLVLALFFCGALTTLLYLARLFRLVFLGEEKARSPGEGSALMVAAVLAPAFIGLALGALIYYPSLYADILTAQLGISMSDTIP